MSINVVIDTNILVAGLIGRKGPNREILRLCFKGELKPVIGNALYLEYQGLLERENIQALCRLLTVSLEEFLDDFASICTPVDGWLLWRPNLPDEADNHIVELAIAANADYIVTNNLKDFAQPELLHIGYEVTSPQQLLRRTRS
jgi:putative PIN family toxin of toxin-antitoxin system